jgi:uncharacterized protein YegP (UPF0339 family)
MAGTFELKASAGQFMFNLKAGNGEPILTSERYTTKASAEGGIASVKVNASDNARYDRKTSASGQSYFVLKGKNGEPLGTSEMYSSVGARDGGIDAVKRGAPTAPTQDLTK